MSAENIYTILSSKPHNPHYLKRYIKFIESCEHTTEYTERHHICPKAKDLFPEYASFKEHPWNVKRLTARQHFIAHKMLRKVYGGSQTHALWQMIISSSKKCQRSSIKSTSRLYETVRVEHAKLLSENEERNRKISESLKGREFSEEHKRNISISKSGVPSSEESNQARKETWKNKSESEIQAYKDLQSKLVSERNASMTPEERKSKYGHSHKRNMKTVTCPHCGKAGSGGNMTRYHFDNCKHLSQTSS